MEYSYRVNCSWPMGQSYKTFEEAYELYSKLKSEGWEASISQTITITSCKGKRQATIM